MKKVIVVMSVLLLSVSMFGCSAEQSKDNVKQDQSVVQQDVKKDETVEKQKVEPKKETLTAVDFVVKRKSEMLDDDIKSIYMSALTVTNARHSIEYNMSSEEEVNKLIKSLDSVVKAVASNYNVTISEDIVESDAEAISTVLMGKF